MPIRVVTEVICDGCGGEIEIRPHYPATYYVELRNADRGRTKGDNFVYGIACHPVLDENKVFHSMECLEKWMEPKCLSK